MDHKNIIIKYKYQILLAVILIIGTVLRFLNLSSQGPFQQDEGIYLLSASTLARIPAALLKVAFLPLGEWSVALKAFFPAGFFEFINARPGFTVINVIGMWIMGVREYAPRFVNAAFGVATIYFVYRIGRDNFKSVFAGLLGALFLAVSKFHTDLSRTGVTHPVSGFFFLLSIYLWLRADEPGARRKRYLILSGLAFGFLITTQYINAIVVALAIFFELIAVLRKNNRHNWSEFWWFIGSAAILPIFWTVVLWLKAYVINSLGFFDDYISPTYLGSIIQGLGEIGGVGKNNLLEAYLAYPTMTSRVDGLLLGVLFGLAPLVFLFKECRRNFSLWFIAVLTYYPIMFLALSPEVSAKNLAMYFPGVIVIISFLIVFLYKRYKSIIFRVIVISILTASVAVTLYRASFITKLHMPTMEAVKFLSERGIQPEEIIAHSWASYQFLFQSPIAASLRDNFLSGKYKYYISDPQDNEYRSGGAEAEFAGYIRRNLKSIAEFKINYGGAFPILVNFSGLNPIGKKEINDLEQNKILSTVRIYDISGLDFNKINQP